MLSSQTGLCQTRERMIRQWILEACKDNGVPKLAKKIRLVWSKRMTSVAGTACYNTNIITLSSQLYERASITQRLQLIKHETCHLICCCKYGFDVQSHGQEWFEVMKNAGCGKEQFHDINTVGLGAKHKDGRHRICCKCNDYWFQPLQFKRIKSGAKFYCQAQCKQLLKIA